jgi:hypothetical protein
MVWIVEFTATQHHQRKQELNRVLLHPRLGWCFVGKNTTNQVHQHLSVMIYNLD